MGRIARLLCAAMLVVLAGVVAVTSFAGAMFKAEPQLVADLTGYSRARAELIEKDLGGSLNSTREGINEQVRQLLSRAPLSAGALAFEGLAALRAGDAAHADRAFGLSYARNPRNEAARIWLAQRAIDGGDLMLAIRLLDGLIAINPERANIYIEAMAQLASLPGGAIAVATRLEAKPRWADQLVSRLNKTLPDLDLLLELNRHTPATQNELVARIVKEAGLRVAFQYWLRLLPEEELDHQPSLTPDAPETSVSKTGGPKTGAPRTGDPKAEFSRAAVPASTLSGGDEIGAQAADAVQFAWPFDSDLRHTSAPAPFNWSVLSDLAEFKEGGGLDLTYLGRGRLSLLEQTILLAPGRYRLVAKLSGDARDNGGGFGWSVECIGDARELGRVIARPLTSKSKNYVMVFEVPTTACEAQKILLRGEPGEFPIRAHAGLQSVAVIPLANGSPP